MPQPTKGPRLGGSPAHQRLILANLATQLFEHQRITTTEAKARRLRPVRRAADHQGEGRRPAQHPADRQADPRQGRHLQARPRDRPVLRRPRGWLHAHHEDAAAQGRQRPHGRDRAGGAEDGDVGGRPRPARWRRRSRRPPAPAAEAEEAPRRVDEDAAERRGPAAEAEEVEESTSTDEAPYGEGSHAPLDDPERGPGGLRDQGQRRLDAVPPPRHAVLRPHGGRGVVRHGRGRRGGRVLASAVAARRTTSPDRPALDRARRPPGRRARSFPAGHRLRRHRLLRLGAAARPSHRGRGAHRGVGSDRAGAGRADRRGADRRRGARHRAGRARGPARGRRPGVARAAVGPAAARRRAGARGHARAARVRRPVLRTASPLPLPGRHRAVRGRAAARPRHAGLAARAGRRRRQRRVRLVARASTTSRPSASAARARRPCASCSGSPGNRGPTGS